MICKNCLNLPNVICEIAMKKVTSSFVIALLIGLLICVGNLSAQPPMGTIKGIVISNQGAISNAQVDIISKNRKSYHRRTVLTDESGEFTIYGLSFGKYELEIKFKCTQATETVTLDSEKPTNLTVILPDENCEEKAANEKAEWKVCEVGNSAEKVEVSDFDKAEIIYQVLDGLLNREMYIDSPIYDDEEITISTENIKANSLLPFPNLKINLLNKREIQIKADKKGDYLSYLVFYEWKQQNNCVYVELEVMRAKGKTAKPMGFCGNGKSGTYLFRKDADKWKRKTVSVF